MAYTSSFNGSHNDQYETRIAQLESQISGLETLVSTNASHIHQLQQDITQFSNHSITKVYYTSTFSAGTQRSFAAGTYIPFDNTIIDTNNNFDPASGAVVVSDTGVYLVTWTSDTNSSTTGTNLSGGIVHTDNDDNVLDYINANFTPKGFSITNIYSALPGDKFKAGSVTSYSSLLITGINRNEFSVYRLQ